MRRLFITGLMLGVVAGGLGVVGPAIGREVPQLQATGSVTPLVVRSNFFLQLKQHVQAQAAQRAIATAPQAASLWARVVQPAAHVRAIASHAGSAPQLVGSGVQVVALRGAAERGPQWLPIGHPTGADAQLAAGMANPIALSSSATPAQQQIASAMAAYQARHEAMADGIDVELPGHDVPPTLMVAPQAPGVGAPPQISGVAAAPPVLPPDAILPSGPGASGPLESAPMMDGVLGLDTVADGPGPFGPQDDAPQFPDAIMPSAAPSPPSLEPAAAGRSADTPNPWPAAGGSTLSPVAGASRSGGSRSDMPASVPDASGEVAASPSREASGDAAAPEAVDRESAVSAPIGGGTLRPFASIPAAPLSAAPTRQPSSEAQSAVPAAPAARLPAAPVVASRPVSVPALPLAEPIRIPDPAPAGRLPAPIVTPADVPQRVVIDTGRVPTDALHPDAVATAQPIRQVPAGSAAAIEPTGTAAMRLPTPLPTLPDLLPGRDPTLDTISVTQVPPRFAECHSTLLDCDRAHQWQLSAPVAAMAWVQADAPLAVLPLGESESHRVAVFDPSTGQVGHCSLATPLSLVTTTRVGSAGITVPTYTLAAEELTELRQALFTSSGAMPGVATIVVASEVPCPVPVVSIAARTIVQRNRAATTPDAEPALFYQGRTADDRAIAVDRTARVLAGDATADTVVQQLPFVPEQVLRGSGEQGAPLLFLAQAAQLHLFDTRTMRLMEQDVVRLHETAGPLVRLGALATAGGFDLLLLSRGSGESPNLLTWLPTRTAAPVPEAAPTAVRESVPAPSSEPTPESLQEPTAPAPTRTQPQPTEPAPTEAPTSTETRSTR